MQIHAIQPAQPTPLITLKNINVVFEQRRHCGILISVFIRIRLLPLSGQMVEENRLS